MLVTGQLVFVHIPRTAGSFIKGVVGGELGVDAGAPRLATHASYDELPPAFRDRPAFAIVRNPWDWYVSWYHHSLAQGPKHARLPRGSPKRTNWKTLFSGGRGTFKEVVTRMCEARLEHPFAASARRRDVDLCSEYVHVLAERAIEERHVEAGRFEELIPFLLTFLDRHRLLTDRLQTALERSPAKNTAVRGPYADYYDQELRELVAHKARRLTERFGYSF
jgi:hypothetical protein